MSYQALYRKLRPQTFADVVGQEHITKTLINQLQAGRVSHAYLFCGTRGTGKTSTAKIFARAINCEVGEGGEPCNECSLCSDSMSGKSMNVIEIDAASNNGVENIRDLREAVKYPPTEGKFKVYIIDEVHMLSTGAFNALLKTLEEPPAHVVFILATTDPQKIPPTIHSRCQRFDFKRISNSDMVLAMKGYMEAEKISVEDSALKYIAHISDGAMRDALSILDQCIAFYYNETITVDKVIETVGSADNRTLFALTEQLFTHDTEGCMKTVLQLVQNGRDISQVASELVSLFRDMLVARSVPQGSAALDYSEDFIEALSETAKKMGTDTLLHYINTFSQAIADMRYSANPRLSFEVTCIRLCSPFIEGEADVSSFSSRLKLLEDMLQNGSLMPPAQQPQNTEQKAEQKPKPAPLEKAVPADIKHVINDWKSFLADFQKGEGNGLMKNLVKTSVPVYLEGDTLTIVTDAIGVLKDPAKQTVLLNAIQAFYKKEFNISLISRAEYDERHITLYGKKDDTLPDLSGKIKLEIKTVSTTERNYDDAPF